MPRQKYPSLYLPMKLLVDRIVEGIVVGEDIAIVRAETSETLRWRKNVSRPAPPTR